MRIRTEKIKKLVFCGFVVCLTVAIFPLLGFSQASAEILLQDDFENGPRSEQIWTFKNPGDFGVVQDRAKAHMGAGVLQMIYRPGTTGPGFEYGSIAPIHDVYVRFYQKFSDNWVWSPIGNKILAIYPSSDNSAYIFWWAKWGSGLLEANWQNGIDNFSAQNLSRDTRMIPGVWQCIEMRTRRSSAGKADGIHQLWIDDIMVMDQRNFDQGSQRTEPWARVMVSAYHNEKKDGQFTIPHVQYRWIDDLVVSTGRIGCLPDTGDNTPPSAPKGLQVTSP